MDCFQILVFLLLFLSYFAPTTVCENTELRALMDMKSSLDPANEILRSWTQTTQGNRCCGFFEGVACNEDGKVATISLQGRGLSGRLSSAVAELKSLSGLYLHYNNLTGNIPEEISNLTKLRELYLNVNNLSGSIPSEIGNMASLQVLDLGCNRLGGSIPEQMGSLTKLNYLLLQHNGLTGSIPASLGRLSMLKSLNLSYNDLSRAIPSTLANIPQLEFLDVTNNNLSGVVPSALGRLNEGLHFANNPGLCGSGITALRVCTAFDNVNIDQSDPVGQDAIASLPKEMPQSVNVQNYCNLDNCSRSSKFPLVAVVAGVTALTVTLTCAGFLAFVKYRRRKQKIGNTSDSSEDRLSVDQTKDFCSKSASPLVSLDYCNGWDPLADGRNGIGFSMEYLNTYRISLEEVESATQYFSEANLLGRSKVSSVYKGTLRDSSLVAIKRINIISCKSEESEFLKGLDLLTSLRHDNLVRLRGFCCSRGRGECFLVYDFASRGTLSQYLNVECGSSKVLDWSTRVSIINGIAKGIGYLHTNEFEKPTIIHRNISAEKILLDQQFRPLICDSGLPALLADDIVFSALKVSAAMGYLAPEYITTGRFTEKSDVYAFGVIILQILSGRLQLTHSMHLAAESCKPEDLMDTNLNNNFSLSDALKLAKIAGMCTHELPDNRPTMKEVIQELIN